MSQNSIISSFADVNHILAQHTPPARRMAGNYTLDSMRTLMQALGNPQDQYKVVHVAGTSGKTSTAYFTAALLQQTGSKVGLTVSPHVDQVNERLQINLEPVPEKQYCQEFQEFMSILNTLSDSNKLVRPPTYFEILVAFAYWEFERQNVDYAVVEVGLGGLLDGTNVVSRDDKISVITDIGLDHVDILGDNLGDIAAQKAGIILPGSVAFCLQQAEEISDVIMQTAKSKGARLFQIKQETDKNSVALPLFQQRNWFLALQVVQYVLERDGQGTLTKTQLLSTIATRIPARMEIVNSDASTIIFDAAHNPQKMQALVSSIEARFPGQKFVVLFALIRSKDVRIHGVLAELIKVAEHIIVTEFVADQDLIKHSTSPEKVVLAANDLGFESVEIIPDPIRAATALSERAERYKLVTGSFYLLHEVHAILGGAK